MTIEQRVQHEEAAKQTKLHNDAKANHYKKLGKPFVAKSDLLSLTPTLSSSTGSTKGGRTSANSSPRVSPQMLNRSRNNYQ